MRPLLIIILSLVSFISMAQTPISGRVIDKNSGETLIGATIIYGKGKGVFTDIDVYYSFKIPSGDRALKISYIGYKDVDIKIKVGSKPQVIDFKLETILLNEIQVVSDIAIDRKTPVAFSTIPIIKINEELASQDNPMELN